MGFREKLGEMFGGSKKEKPIEQSLEKWGLKVIADKKLHDRLAALQVFFDELDADITEDTPLEYLGELKTRQEKLNRAIHSLAVPYYRAGSSAQFRELMEGWQLWHSLALYWLNAIEDRITGIQEDHNGHNGTEDKANTALLPLLKVTTIDIETLVRRIHTVLQLHVWQDGQLVMAESYQNLDVSGSGATIIKTMTTGYGQRLELDDVVDERTE